jgi:hypothetical protein
MAQSSSTTQRSTILRKPVRWDICQVIEEATQFVEYGFFNVTVNGVSAHIELNNSILVSTSQFFSHDTFSIGLPGTWLRFWSQFFSHPGIN